MNGSNSHRDRYAVYLYAYPISASLLGQYSTLTLMLNTSNTFFLKLYDSAATAQRLCLWLGLWSHFHIRDTMRERKPNSYQGQLPSLPFTCRVIWVQPHGSPLVVSYMLSWHCASSRDRSDIDRLLVDELTTHTVFCVTINVRLID